MMKRKIIGFLTALAVAAAPIPVLAENAAADEATYTWNLTATDRTIDATDTAVYALVDADGTVTDSDSSGWKSSGNGEIGIAVAGNGKNMLSAEGLRSMLRYPAHFRCLRTTAVPARSR